VTLQISKVEKFWKRRILESWIVDDFNFMQLIREKQDKKQQLEVSQVNIGIDPK